MPPRPKKSTPQLYYAFLGDIIGAPYEFAGKNATSKNFDLFPKSYDEYVTGKRKKYRTRFSDDSALTAAIAELVMENVNEQSRDAFRVKSIKKLKEYYQYYPDNTFPGGYGSTYSGWAARKDDMEIMWFNKAKGIKSCGDGAAMRVSSVGNAVPSLKRGIQLSGWTTDGSHGDPESDRGASAITACEILIRAGVSKEDIAMFIESTFGYDMSKTIEDYRNYHFKELKHEGNNQSEICQTTVQMAIKIFLESNSYEECMRLTGYIGGDSDTIGSMAGGLAGLKYGMPKWLERECEKRLDDRLKQVAKDFSKKFDVKETEPDMDEIEVALAQARVKHLALTEYKKSLTSRKHKEYVPADDERFLDLLAQSESTRLFYEEVKKIGKNKITDEQALRENKDELIKQIKEKLLHSPELQKEWKKMEDCPAKTVRYVDLDEVAGKRVKGVPRNAFPLEYSVVDHEKIPEKVVADYADIHTEIQSFLRVDALNEALKAQALRNQVAEQVKEAMAQQAPAAEPEDGTVKTDAQYKPIIDGMVSKEGELGKYFPSEEKMPALLKDALKDLENMSDFRNCDPVQLSTDALKKLDKLYKDMLRNTPVENNAEAVQQMAFINRLAAVITDWQNAPEDPQLVEENLMHIAETRAKEALLATEFHKYDEGYVEERDKLIIENIIAENGKEFDHTPNVKNVDDLFRLQVISAVSKRNYDPTLHKQCVLALNKVVARGLKNDEKFKQFVETPEGMQVVVDVTTKARSRSLTDKLDERKKALRAIDNEASAQFKKFAEKLHAASRHDSREYKEITTLLDSFGNKRFGLVDEKGKLKPEYAHLTEEQKTAVRFALLHKGINKYLNHKAKDGINKNAYDKLAAIEELNQYVSGKLKEINPGDFSITQMQQDETKTLNFKMADVGVTYQDELDAAQKDLQEKLDAAQKDQRGKNEIEINGWKIPKGTSAAAEANAKTFLPRMKDLPKAWTDTKTKKSPAIEKDMRTLQCINRIILKAQQGALKDNLTKWYNKQEDQLKTVPKELDAERENVFKQTEAKFNKNNIMSLAWGSTPKYKQ